MTKAEKMAEAARMYAEGKTTYEIGRALGHSHSYIWTLLMDAGVKTRGPGPRGKSVTTDRSSAGGN